MRLEPPDLEGLWDRSRVKMLLEACVLLNCYSFPSKIPLMGARLVATPPPVAQSVFVPDLGDTTF